MLSFHLTLIHPRKDVSRNNGDLVENSKKKLFGGERKMKDLK